MISTALFVKMVLDRWNGSVANLDRHLNGLTDEQLHRQVAPGRNRGIYLLGHLIAVHDEMLQLLDMGGRMFPGLNEPFLIRPDNAAVQVHSASELRTFWSQQCGALRDRFEKMQSEQWFEKHTAVSVDEFSREPHRNKLNIVISRTSHLQYHTGQLVLLNKTK